MSNNSINCFLFLTSGGLNSYNNIIEICNNKDIQDYETITDLIKQVSTTRSEIITKV
jgi:hypothetical protein